jgi:hypothetical protein
MPFFAVGVVWTYLLALSSVERLADLFPPDLWRVLRTAGLEYIALVFFADLVILPIESNTTHLIDYVPFSILLIAGAFLRTAATVCRLGGGHVRRWKQPGGRDHQLVR